MGNDGGSIPSRRELVRNKGTERGNAGLQESQWLVCRMSQEALREPLVSDVYGYLYNKSAILQHLIAPESITSDDAKATFSHITSLRDVVEVHFYRTSDGQRICPLTRQEVSSRGRFVQLIPCGHVFEERARKQALEKTCTECTSATQEEVLMNPQSEPDLARASLRASKLAEQGVSHSLQPLKTKKRKKADKEEKIRSKRPLIASELATKITDKVMSQAQTSRLGTLSSGARLTSGEGVRASH